MNKLLAKFHTRHLTTWQAKFHSKEVPEGNYKVMCELLVEYKYPAINKEAEAEQE